MASKRVIVTGDKELTRMLNALGLKTAGKLHRTASRKAAKLVLEGAKAIVPKRTGAYQRALTVRAMKKSRVRRGYLVTQRPNYAAGKGRKEAFYGVFQELGWKAGGKRRGFYGASDMPLEQLIATTKRKMKPDKRSAKGGRKIEGKWAVKKAGDVKEPAAIRLYHEELAKLIAAEA